MEGQIDLFEAFPKIMQKEVPELWDCMKTCARANIHTDHFPETNEKRCLYGWDREGGKFMISKLIDNTWHTRCKYYKVKG